MRKYNVAKRAEKFLKSLEKTRLFKGVLIDRIEKECCWHKQYAIFIIYMDDATIKTKKEFLKFVETTFPGCVVKCYSCGEYEIMGPDCDKIFSDYRDDIEEQEMNHEGHWVFEC